MERKLFLILAAIALNSCMHTHEVQQPIYKIPTETVAEPAFEEMMGVQENTEEAEEEYKPTQAVIDKINKFDPKPIQKVGGWQTKKAAEVLEPYNPPPFNVDAGL